MIYKSNIFKVSLFKKILEAPFIDLNFENINLNTGLYQQGLNTVYVKGCLRINS